MVCKSLAKSGLLDEQEMQSDIYGSTSTHNPKDDVTSPSREPTKCVSINRHMIPAKIAYFFNVSRREIDTYFVLFFISLGFNPTEAGIISGLQYIGGIIGAPSWSYLADKFRIHKTLVIVMCIMALVFTSLQPLLGLQFADSDKYRCPRLTNVTKIDDHSYQTTHGHNVLFYSILLLAIIGKSFDASAASFVDSGCLHRVQTSPTKTSYGGQRFIGSLGVGFGGLAYSMSIQYYPRAMMSCECGIFMVYAMTLVCLSVSCHYLFRGFTTVTKENVDKNVNKLLLTTLKNFDTLFFLLCVLFGGIAQGLYFNFLFLRLKELNAISLIFGYQTCVVALSGSFIYFYSSKIINLVGGTMNAMVCSIFVWAIRFMCVSLLTTSYYIFPIEIIHGLTYALFLNSAFEHVNEVSDPLILTSMCGVINGLYIELGSLISNILGGRLYHVYGGRQMFVICSVACGSWGLVMAAYQVCKCAVKKRRYRVSHHDRTGEDL